VLTAHGQTAADAGHAQLVAEARRTPAELRRRPDGLEEVEAITRGASVPAWPTAVTFHPDGTRVALIDNHGAVDLWHWAEDRHIRQQVGPGYFQQAAFSRDGKTLLTTDGEGGACIYQWNAQNGALQAQAGGLPFGWPETPPQFWQRADRLLAFLPGPVANYQLRAMSQALGAAALPLPQVLSEIQGRRVTPIWTPPSPVHALHVNASGRWLAMVPATAKQSWWLNELGVSGWAIGELNVVEVYDVDSGQKRAVLHPQHSPSMGLTSSNDGSLIVTWSHTNTRAHQQAEVWDSQSGQRLARLPGPPAAYFQSLLSPPQFPFSSGDGRWLIFAQGARHVLWDAQTRKTRALSTAWGSAAFVADTSLLIDAPSPCVRAPITVWDLTTDRRIPLQNPTNTRNPTPIEEVGCRKWPPRPDSLYVDRGRTPPRSAAHGGVGLLAVWNFSYSTSGTGGYHVYGPEGDRAIRLFDLRTGAVWATLGPHDAPVRFVEFSRDGRLVLTVDAEANMKLWRVQPASPNPPPAAVPPPPPELGWRRLEP
jgi:WD40 repeat protein